MLSHFNVQSEKPSRVVIIGAGGFIGSAINRQLQAKGITTLPLTRKDLNLFSDGARKNLKNLLKSSDSVVMVSAIAPAKTVQMLVQNLRMTETVCAVLAEAEISHLVYISSDAVYSDDANPVTESSLCAPSTLHGMMHAARELMLKNSTSAPLVVLRPTLIYGADDPHNGYGPNRFRREAEKGGPILIFGEGEEQRDHVLVDDVAKLAELVLAYRSSGVLNVVTGSSISFHAIAQMIADQYRVALNSQPRLGPRPHLLHRFFDVTNCFKAFPTFHYTPIREGVASIQESLNKNP